MIPACMFGVVLLSCNFLIIPIAQSRPLCLEGAFPAPKLEKLLPHEDPVYSVTWSPDGRHLASASKVALSVYSSEGWKLQTKLRQESTTSLRSVAWSPDGTQLASASLDKRVRIWNTSSWQMLRTLSGHSDWVFSVAWHPDGTKLASASKDRLVKVWDISSSKLPPFTVEHDTSVNSVAWSPDGKWVASASMQTVKIWRGNPLRNVRKSLNHQGNVRSVAWSPDGGKLASEDRSAVLVWDTSTWKLLVTLSNHTRGVVSLAWSPDGRLLASASKDNSVMIWDTSTGKPLQTPLKHSGNVLSVAWSPDGRRLASASEDSVSVRDVKVHIILSEDPAMVQDHVALVLSQWIYNASILANNFRCPPTFVLPTRNVIVQSTLMNVVEDDPENRLSSFFAYVRLTSVQFIKRSLYVVFRGTDAIADVLTEMGIQDNHIAYQNHGVGIHTGFHQEIANRARWHHAEMMELLEDIARQDEEDGVETEIILTGHSMGGAHAAALYVLLQFSGISKNISSIGNLLKRVRLVSFAAPMIFAKFIREGVHVQPSKEFLRVMSSAINYVHRNDPVPRAYSELPVGKFLDAVWREQSGATGMWLAFVQDKYNYLQRLLASYEKYTKMYRHFSNLRLLNHTRPWYKFDLSAESFKDHLISSYDDAFRNSKHSLVKYSDVVSSHDEFDAASSREEL